MTTVQKAFTVNLVNRPAWLPNPGQSVSISANGLMDVRDTSICPTHNNGASGQAPWNLMDQTGLIYNPYYGANGALIWWGGGHFGYKGNAVYIFPIQQDGSWTRLTNDYQQDDYNSFINGGPNRWYDISGLFNGQYDQSGTNLGTGNYGDYNTIAWDSSSGWYGNSPATTHTRGEVICVPGGSGGLGQMIVPYIHGNYAGQGFRYTHVFDCGFEPINALTYDSTKRWWKRGGQLLTNVLPVMNGMYQGGGCWYEPDLNRVGIIGTVFESSTQRRIMYADTTTWNWTQGPSTNFGVFMYMETDQGCVYIPNRRLLIYPHGPNSNNVINGSGDPDNGTGHNCIQFTMIDLSDTSAGFLNIYRMSFTNPTAGPQMPYRTNSNGSSGTTTNAGVSGIYPIYCDYDGALYFAWSSRHLPTYNAPYQLGDTMIWRLKPANRDLRSGDTNSQIIADQWTWTNLTETITPRVTNHLMQFAMAPTTSGGNGGNYGVWDHNYRGMHWIAQLGCFVFFRGVHGVGSPFFATVQLFKPADFP